MCMLSHFSHDQLFANLWTAAHQGLLSMGFSRQEYWSGLPHPPPGDLPNPGIEPASLASPALAGRFFTTNASWEVPPNSTNISKKKKKSGLGKWGTNKDDASRVLNSACTLELIL